MPVDKRVFVSVALSIKSPSPAPTPAVNPSTAPLPAVFNTLPAPFLRPNWLAILAMFANTAGVLDPALKIIEITEGSAAPPIS